MFRVLIVVPLTLLFVACASPQLTEQQKYEKLQDSFKYDSYRKLSKAGIGAVVDGYNHVAEKEDKPLATKPYVFSMSSFVWLMAMQPDFAIADANTARRKKASDKARYISLATQSMAFYQKGWSGLAVTFSEEANRVMSKGSFNETYKNELQLAYLVMGGLAIYNGDSTLAQNSFQGLGDSIGKPWLADLARIAVAVKEGAFSESLRLVKGLRDNEKLSISERKLLAGLEKTISEKKSKNISREITDIAFEALLENEKNPIAELERKIKKFQKSVDL